VRELETVQVGDLDEHRRAIRLRWTFEKNERYRHLDLPDDLFSALLATLPQPGDEVGVGLSTGLRLVGGQVVLAEARCVCELVQPGERFAFAGRERQKHAALGSSG
jgi:hypothetical protein